MEKTMNKECELNQEIKQESDSKVDQSINSLDEETLDSITGGADQYRSTGGGSVGDTYKPAPVVR